jgi:hypothetical protein
MAKGKPWSSEDEKKLKDWITSGVSVDALVFSFDGQYTKDAIYKKIERLGLEVVEQKKITSTTTAIELPQDLPSVEETMIKLAAALITLKEPGLEKNDILRLRALVSGYKIYKELLVDYLNYRGLEAELSELRKKYGELSKGKGVSPK